MSDQIKTSYSWTAVVILLVLFWPVGLFMLFSKLSNDRTASFGGGAVIIKFIGVVLVFFGAIMLIAISSGDGSVIITSIIMSLLFALPGFFLIKKSKEIKNYGSKSRQYIEYIINNQIHDIHELARRMSVSQDVVIKDVNGMINRGMLGAARLNLNSGIIEFPRPKQRPVQQRQRPIETKRPAHVYESFEPKTIRCTSCSANNFVESLPETCEYCGSSLHE